MTPKPAGTFQDMLLALQKFWADHGCALVQPYPSEVGAGTFNPATFLRALGPEPWNVAYVEPSRRPKDGRYGENPNRIQNFYQYQVLLKPAPENVLELYEQSLRAMGIDLDRHDLRYVEDDWESPTLGAWGLGWEVWLDGMEVTQFTYFQQVGSIDVDLVPAEITYGIERLATYLQGAERIMDLQITRDFNWKDLFLENEKEFCAFNFEQADVDLHFRLFSDFEGEAERLLGLDLVGPGYDYVIKCSHAFNMLEARGAISVTERTGYIGRVRRLSRLAAQAYVRQRERLGFPMISDEAVRTRLVEEAGERARKRKEREKKKAGGGKNAGGGKKAGGEKVAGGVSKAEGGKTARGGKTKAEGGKTARGGKTKAEGGKAVKGGKTKAEGGKKQNSPRKGGAS